MIKEPVIEAYMLNSKRAIAEMLYDTVNSYEERTCESCKHIAIYNRRELRCSKGVVESRALDNNSKSFGCNKWEKR